MKKLNKDLLAEALRILAELTQDQPTRHFVVCGGSSLLALGLVNRKTTKDVDVLASLVDGTLVTATPLPAELLKAIELVRDDLGLMENWFNTGPSDDTFFRFGFPDGILSRVVSTEYGKSLIISYIERYDQIFFKLYAAADSGPGRHLDDLIELSPTEEELIAAIHWVFRQDDSEGFKTYQLTPILAELGYADLLERI
jgi:hypothetical protein